MKVEFHTGCLEQYNALNVYLCAKENLEKFYGKKIISNNFKQTWFNGYWVIEIELEEQENEH